MRARVCQGGQGCAYPYRGTGGWSTGGHLWPGRRARVLGAMASASIQRLGKRPARWAGPDTVKYWASHCSTRL